MTKLSKAKFQRIDDAYHERLAVNFISPGLFMAIYMIGVLIDVECKADEDLSAFATRVLVALDAILEDCGYCHSEGLDLDDKELAS